MVYRTYVSLQFNKQNMKVLILFIFINCLLAIPKGRFPKIKFEKYFFYAPHAIFHFIPFLVRKGDMYKYPNTVCKYI